MTDYRALIAPYLESIRTPRTTTATLKSYTKRLLESIDILGQGGFDSPCEEYYEALAARLGHFAAPTRKDRLSLSRRFFTWAASKEGDEQIPMTSTAQQEQQEQSIPLSPSVDAQQTEQHPQDDEGAVVHSGRPRKSTEARSQKLTLYLTPSLSDDVKDLARIQRLSTPDYIFRLIERERDRRKDALETFRALEED